MEHNVYAGAVLSYRESTDHYIHHEYSEYLVMVCPEHYLRLFGECPVAGKHGAS